MLHRYRVNSTLVQPLVDWILSIFYNDTIFGSLLPSLMYSPRLCPLLGLYNLFY
jgi:hypothetical protein